MLEFIKMFGLGILYTILFPFIVVFFALVLVGVLINYLVLEVINLSGFFFGNTFTVETKLDKKLRQMKEEAKNALEKDNEDLVSDVINEEGSDLDELH